MQISSPDWFCPKCGFDNLGIHPHCQRCYAHNPFLYRRKKVTRSKPASPASNIAAKAFSGMILTCVIVCGGLGVLLMLIPGPRELNPPVTKAEGKALRESVKNSLVDDKTPPDEARQILQVDYLKLLQHEFPVVQGITIEVQLTPGGYRLYGVHSDFTAKTFAAGPKAKAVNRWIEERGSDLKQARITRVGVRNEGHLGECGYDIKESN